MRENAFYWEINLYEAFGVLVYHLCVANKFYYVKYLSNDFI
jgi:hypothetical protein